MLVGWMTGIEVLTSFLPGWLAMKVNTAIGFLLSGLALMLLASPSAPVSRRLTGLVCAAAAALLGLLTFLQYPLDLDVGIDQLLFPEASGAVETVHLGRMAPATALAFVFAGIALLLPRHRLARTFQVLVHLTGLLALISACHYIYLGRPILPYTQMAIHTAVLFLLLAAGMLATRPDSSLVTVLTGDTPGGRVARRLLPAAMLVPLILGWLLIHGDTYGWYDFASGVLLFAVITVAILGGLVWVYALRLNQAELKRKAAKARIMRQLERLNLLEQVTRAIGEHQDPSSIQQVVVRRLESSLPLDFSAILLCATPGGSVQAAHCGEKLPELAAALRTVDFSGPALEQAKASQLFHEPDLAAADGNSALLLRLREAGLGATVLAPLAVDGQVFGFLLAARRTKESFSSGLCEFLTQVAAHTSLATHQARLLIQLQQAYDELRSTHQTKLQQERLSALGQMASGIVHDINNAITPASFSAEIVLNSETNLNPKSRELLENIQKSVTNIAQTVARLRGFYDGQGSKQQLVPVDLNALIKETVKLTRARWSDMPQQTGVVINLTQELAEDLPKIEGVEVEIRDALINLIINAADAMPQGGTITVRTRLWPAGRPDTVHSRVALEVADTGVGMDEETRRRCLEPFYSTKGDKGTGMGLAMVYGAVQRNGGTLDIESTPGKGTTFRISFPLPVAKPQETVAMAAGALKLRPLQLLLVDDDPLILRTLSEVLSSDGHTLTTGSSGQAGIAMLASAHAAGKRFDAVITDLGMPQMDGRAVAAAAKEHGGIPVIMLTGWGQRMSDGTNLPANVDILLAKPPNIAELRAALAGSVAVTGC